jgi:GWxTD domain-containing protein
MWGAPGALLAQAPAQRLALRELRDSLARSQDSPALLALERQALEDARARRDDPIPKLRLGFIDLRLAALTADASRYNDAASEFEWTTQLQPEWPMGWLGRGFAELGSVELGSAVARVGQLLLGVDPASRPAHFLALSARVDSTYIDGLMEIASLALRQRSDVQLSTALKAFREVSRTPVARVPNYLLMLGRIEREVGDLDSAAIALHALLQLEPDNPAGLLEYGRTRFVSGLLDGEEAWYRGLAVADDRTLAEYRSDLEVLMGDSLLAKFDASSGNDRVRMVRQFWESRPGAELLASSERLREHYIRLGYVWRNLLVRPQQSYDATPRADIQPAWPDDRGRIYLKHGRPDETTYIKFTGAYDNESWRYRMDDGTDMLFHFLKPPGAPGYRSVESLFDIIATTTAARMKGVVNPAEELAAGNAMETFGAGWLASTAQEILVSRAYMSPIYARILNEGKRSTAQLQAEERVNGKASLEAPDTWRMTYPAGLDARIDALAVGSDSSGASVQVAFALPGATLSPTRTAFGWMYQVRVRAVLLGLDGSRVAALDRTKGYITRNFLAPNQFVLGRMPMSAPPGTYQVKIAVESEGRGTITAWDTVRVPGPGPSVGVSDLVLGSRSVRLTLSPVPGDSVWVNPVHEFRRGEPMELYFEVGGLSRSADYRVEIGVLEVHGSALGKLLAGGGESMRLAFDMKHAGGTDRLHRELDLRRLGPGTYLMRVVVTTAGGERVTRQRTFTVVK